jgi:hypothetical protein
MFICATQCQISDKALRRVQRGKGAREVGRAGAGLNVSGASGARDWLWTCSEAS